MNMFFYNANHIKKFSATSKIVSKQNFDGIGVVASNLYFHNGTTVTKILDNANNAAQNSSVSLSTLSITNPTFVDGAATRFDHKLVASLTGAALHAGVVAAFSFDAAVLIQRVVLDLTTVATAVCTLDVGYTATSATTASDTLLDGIDVHTATGMFDSNDGLLDTGTNAHAQKAAAGSWITVKEATGDATDLVAKLYVTYTLI